MTLAGRSGSEALNRMLQPPSLGAQSFVRQDRLKGGAKYGRSI